MTEISAHRREQKRLWEEANREKRRAYEKARYQRDKEKRRALGKRWAAKNAEQVADYNKQYYAENKERINARNRAYNEANKEKMAEAKRRWAASNKEKTYAYKKKWKDGNPPKMKCGHLRKRYGITLVQWEELFAQQGNCCAICKTTDPGTQNWHTDHCHTTGMVRGILCSRCNLGLGRFNDNADLFDAAAAYLRKASNPTE